MVCIINTNWHKLKCVRFVCRSKVALPLQGCLYFCIHEINYVTRSSAPICNHPSHFALEEHKTRVDFHSAVFSGTLKHPLAQDYWRAFTGELRPWKETFLATMDPVCVAGAADMNRALKYGCELLASNQCKQDERSYQLRQTPAWAVTDQTRWGPFFV